MGLFSAKPIQAEKIGVEFMVNELSAGGEERKTRVRLPKNRRRNQILDAAEEVFSDRGYEVATIAEVAVLAGTAEGNVYRYFETKRDLLASVIARWYEAAIAELEEKTVSFEGSGARLEFLIHFHICALRDNPGLLGLIIREVRTHNDTYKSVIGNLNRRYTGYVSQALIDGVAAGDFNPNLPISLVRDMVFGCIEHHTWRYVSQKDTSEMDVEMMTQEVIMLLRSGIERRTSLEDGAEALKAAKAHIRLAEDILNHI